MSRPAVFGLPPGVDFARLFLKGLEERLGQDDPLLWARTEILVNTERARRRLLTLIEDGPVRLVPRIRVLSELGQGGIASDAPLKRRLELEQLVRELIHAEPDIAGRTAAFDLADSLALVLGEMQEMGLAWAALDRVSVDDLSGHWQRSLRFLGLIRAFLEATERGDAEAERRAAMLAMAAELTAAPPDYPVIIAGSTGSRGATPDLMAAVAGLPAGSVVLPGLDRDLPSTIWSMLARPGASPDHPQWGFARLGGLLGFDPAETPLWTAPEEMGCRSRLISLAMRPAPVTDQWLSEGPALTPELTAASDGIAWIEAPGAGEEARAIALLFRQALEEGTRAALVTPDRNLARRVAAEMDRWGVVPDDSAGRPLALTPPGIFLRLIQELRGSETEAATLAALLKHPLTVSTEEGRGPHLRLARAFELDVLRRGGGRPTPAIIATWAEDKGEGAGPWAAWLTGVLQTEPPADVAIAEHLKAHIALAERVAAGPVATGSGGLWEEEAGVAAAALIADLQSAVPAGGVMDAAEYRAAFASILNTSNVPRDAFEPHPDIAIWGPLEARIQSADLMILGGLNEGIWPKQPDPDPWFNRQIREALGLPVAERQIGLAAHDFQQAVCSPKVVITRSLRDAEAPTVASRWLLRLENLLEGLGVPGQQALASMRERGAAILTRGQALEVPGRTVPAAPRPAPVPPVAARPARLPVTRITTLIRDPYAVYARDVLHLRPLDPIGREPDVRERGTAYHAAMEHFVRLCWDRLPEDGDALFLRALDESLTGSVPWPAIRELWRARLAGNAQAFLVDEAARRQRGAPVALEVKGRLPLNLAAPFVLEARADRIDRAPDGSLLIYDYKGTLPTLKQIQHFDPQLQLEALIAEAGGFQGVPAGSVLRLELIGLGATGGSRLVPDTEAEIRKAERGLLELIAAYQSSDTPFPARTRPARIAYAGDYDHLSRYGEWTDGAPYVAENVG